MDKIFLTDVDRPGEPLLVEVQEIRGDVLVLSVPNTSVSFYMRRGPSTLAFKGSIGGRDFIFDPSTLKRANGVPTKARPVHGEEKRPSSGT
jgi:hypothetical protein